MVYGRKIKKTKTLKEHAKKRGLKVENVKLKKLHSEDVVGLPKAPAGWTGETRFHMYVRSVTAGQDTVTFTGPLLDKHGGWIVPACSEEGENLEDFCQALDVLMMLDARQRRMIGSRF